LRAVSATLIEYSGDNPNAPDNLVILYRDRVRSLRLLGLLTRKGRDESTHCARSEAQANNQKFRRQRHELVSVLVHTVTPKLLPIGASK
jgi:hypothetical protein